METGKSAEYFSHDCNAKDDPKIMLLMAQLGLEAYGIYWILVEYLRQQPQYKAPLNLLDPLSRRYGSSKEKFETVVTKFGLFETDNECFYSPSLNRRMAPLDQKRGRMQQLALMRWDKEADAHAMRTHSVGNAQAMQSKVKESKVKKSKVEKNKEVVFDFSSNPEFSKQWEKWKAFRVQMKKSYKTAIGERNAYSELMNLSNQDNETAISIIKQSINREWLGFFPLKNNIKQSLPGEDPVERKIREVTEYMNQTK